MEDNQKNFCKFKFCEGKSEIKKRFPHSEPVYCRECLKIKECPYYRSCIGFPVPGKCNAVPTTNPDKDGLFQYCNRCLRRKNDNE